MKIATQGAKGAFHEYAAKKWFGENTEFVYCNTFSDVFRALSKDDAGQALVAIENSLYGSINDVYDLLQKHHFSICGEVILHIHQQLIGLPGVQLHNIQEVYSQDVALAQCQNFLSRDMPQATLMEYHDTAASVAHIKNKQDPKLAAIASRFSAEAYEMPIIASDIEDNPQNYTRFVALSKKPKPTEGANKASLILTTDHTPGALYRALGVFAKYDANLTTMHSRPIAEKPWRHTFYIDVDITGETLRDIVSELEKQGATTTILGEYEKSTITYDT